jgi:hypothetical protein
MRKVVGHLLGGHGVKYRMWHSIEWKHDAHQNECRAQDLHTSCTSANGGRTVWRVYRGSPRKRTMHRDLEILPEKVDFLLRAVLALLFA